MKVISRGWAAGAVLALLCFVAAGQAARANDSASEFGIGGLVMVKTDAITMQREDLTITPNWVTVRYEFRNDGPAPVTLRVAFPLPEVPVFLPGGQMIGETKVDVFPFNPPNFVAFLAWADGKAIEPEIEIRAELPDGRSVLDELREIGGWSLVLNPRMFVNRGRDEIDALDIGPRVFRQLEEIGALGPRDETSDGYGWARWKTRITYHWEQTFRPGVTVVEHRYQPMAGFSMFRPDLRSWKDGPVDQAVAERHCIDDAARRDLEGLQTPPGTPAALEGWMIARTLAYVLTTGANWAGPIETFNLVIDGSVGRHDWTTVRFAVGCADLPLRRVGPTRLEATAQNYVPTRDLRILLVTDARH